MTKPIIGLISLGCAKNQVDSEVMLGYLREEDFPISYQAEECQIIIINTCSFIDKAREEAIETILEIAQLKKSGNLQRLIVTGCLPERYRDKLLKALPEIDVLLGVNQLPEITRYCNLEKKPIPKTLFSNNLYLYDHKTPRLLTTPPYTAYLKIAEGCSHKCSFCAVPLIRGPYRSRSTDSLVKESQNLAALGVRELNIIAQDTSFFAFDRGERNGLCTLLRALAQIEEFQWIRILYCHPEHISPQLIETIASENKICSYLDIPLQHVDGKLLKKMGRRGDRNYYVELINSIRSIIPHVTLRTSFIVGFPGEGEEEFKQLRNFIEEIKFDRLGVFTYSIEEGTKAYSLGDPIPPVIKEKRYNELMELQAKISLQKNRNLIGQTQEVLIEDACQESIEHISGRLASQAPEVDGRVLINKGIALPGDFYPLKIVDAFEYDLIGHLVKK
jgi:ribosomal protein S12 methylthiotransferase